MSKDIKVTGALVFPEGVPTRAGEAVNSVGEIYDIPAPRVGMIVYDKSTGINYIVRSLKAKVIDGVLVDNAQVDEFEELLEKQVSWINEGNSASNMNDFVDAGVYDIKGERTRSNDNLPILNTGGGNSFNARLTVLDSSIAPGGKSDDICITQKLTLSNRVAGDGDVYIRTGRGTSKDAITWETWGKLQQNVEVGEVDNLDNLIDNGIYSGVWTKGQYNAYPVTFVCVVINDYFIGIAPRRISQFLYGLSKFDGLTVYQTRVWNDKNNKWSDWEIINKAEINSMISAEIKKVTDGIDPDKIDSIKDIVAWIDDHGGDVTAIYKAIQENTTAINNEITRATNAESNIEIAMYDITNALFEQIKNVNANALQYNKIGFTANAERVQLYAKNVNDDKVRYDEINAATTTTAGVMSAADKVTLNKAVNDIEAEATRAENAEGELNTAISNEIVRAVEREDAIASKALKADTAYASPNTEVVNVWGKSVDGSNNMSITIPAATTEKAGVMTAQDKKALDTATSRALRTLFVAAGAEYNDSGVDVTKTAPWGETVTHKAGCYYLNGLGDITEIQMVAIYNMGKYWLSQDVQGFGCETARTNLPPKEFNPYYYKTFDLTQSFNNTQIEVVALVGASTLGTNREEVKVSGLNFFTQSAKMLKRVIGVLNADSVPANKATINGEGLEFIYIKKLKVDASIHKAKSLNKESILYLIDNATPTTAITITLHPDAYARLADDADVVAALEAKPLITLVSA